MSKSPHAHFTTLSKRLRALAKQGDLKAFEVYLAGNDYYQSMGGLQEDPVRRVRALKLMVQTMRACERCAKPLVARGSVRVKRWDAAMIAKLRAAEAKHGTDEGIARELGIPIKAVRPARWKYVGPRQPRGHPTTRATYATLADAMGVPPLPAGGHLLSLGHGLKKSALPTETRP